MTKERLEQFRSLRKEIKQLEQRIKKLQQQLDYFVSDTVTGSTQANPDKHVIVISGYGGEHVAKLAALEELYTQRQSRCISELHAIETFINSIQDSTIRQIVQLRYVDDKHWPEVSQTVFGYPSADVSRMAINRHFEKIQPCSVCSVLT